MVLMANKTTQFERIFEDEFMPHSDALYNFAYHLTGNEDDANDLFQEALMKAWRFIDKYEAGTNAKSWLFTIAKNAFINEYRRKVKTLQLRHWNSKFVDSKMPKSAAHHRLESLL